MNFSSCLITQEIDDQLNERVLEAKGLLERILESESIEDALMQNSSKIDQIFIQAVSSELKSVKENKDGEREEKLEVLLQSIQKLTTPPELEVVEALLRVAEDEGKTNELIAELNEQLLARVIEYLTAIISNYDEQISSAAPDDLEIILARDSFSKGRIIKTIALPPDSEDVFIVRVDFSYSIPQTADQSVKSLIGNAN